VTLHHEVRGDGPAVLLVHAGVADGRMWTPFAERVAAAGHRVIVPDLQGFGRTPLAPGTVSHPADLGALLVIAGADDVEDFVAIAGRLADELPGAGEVVTIAGAAHLPALERPAEVADLMVAFLAARSPSPG
jgi:pimeloyl-ACP methyl ester carboxylesterase